jgi:hypothetical protein
MEGGMQQATPEVSEAIQEISKGACRLGLAEHMRMLASAYNNSTRGVLLRGADEIENLTNEVLTLRRAVYRDRIVVVEGGVVPD